MARLWIGTGCHLESGAEISRSILFDYSRIGSSGEVTDSLVFGRNCVDQNGDPVPDLKGALDWVLLMRENCQVIADLMPRPPALFYKKRV